MLGAFTRGSSSLTYEKTNFGNWVRLRDGTISSGHWKYVLRSIYPVSTNPIYFNEI